MSESRPHWMVEFKHARGVGDHVEHHVALRPVVEDAPTAAHDRRTLTREVVDGADARRELERTAVLQFVVDALARLERAVEAVGAWRQPADEAAFNGVAERRRHAGLEQRRVHAAAGVAGARALAPTHTG